MLKTLIVQAPAKINLTLWVKQKRPDGYHDIETIMQTITLQDTLMFKQQKTDGITIECANPVVPVDASNLVHRAARLVLESNDLPPGLWVGIEKRIPVAAGLAGGSSNAAATLSGLTRMYDQATTLNDLMDMGAKLGSDIPFMVHGGLAVATGRGEQLTFYDAPRPSYHVVVAIPTGLQVSTKWAYENYTPRTDPGRAEKMREILAAYRHRDMATLRKLAFNDLEAVTLQRHPEVQRLKEILDHDNNGLVLMSGSGPSVFGLFLEHREAIHAATRIDAEKYDVFVEKTNKAHL